VNTQALEATAKMMVANGKGLIAIDESTTTCNKRFDKWEIPQTAETRRKYRELIVSTPGLGESISGAILYDKTIRQQKNDGTPFAKALMGVEIIPGIKVDTEAEKMAACPGEKITEGLAGLRACLTEYAQMGARLAKWRAVIAIGDGLPSEGCIEANAHVLARYATLCQKTGLVPVVELEGLILKPNMVLPGSTCPKQATVNEVADATVSCLLRAVPAAVPGVAFLSGGQTGELASAHLNAMNVRFKSRLPWALAFSFGRAIQKPAFEIWHGDQNNVQAAQQALYHRARSDRAARRGEYNATVEADHRDIEPLVVSSLEHAGNVQ